MMKLTNQEIREKMKELLPDLWEEIVKEYLDNGAVHLLLMDLEKELERIERCIEKTEDLDELQEQVKKGNKVEEFYNQLKLQYPEPVACPA